MEGCGLLVWVNFGDGGMAPVQSGIELFDQPHLSATTFHEGHEWAVLLCKGFLPLSGVGCRRLEVDVTAHDIVVIIVRSEQPFGQLRACCDAEMAYFMR
jgi:hypothetical protein